MNDAARQPQDTAARAAGLLLLLTAAATLVSVVARLSADADEPTLAKSLAAIAQNKVLYGVGGAARFVSGLTLIGAAWFLSRTWAIRAWRGARLAPVLLVLSGICTAVSGACAIALAATLEAPAEALPAGVLMAVDPSAETIAYFRWVAGKVGFTLAGLARRRASGRRAERQGPSRRHPPPSGSRCCSSGSTPRPSLTASAGLLSSSGSSLPASRSGLLTRRDGAPTAPRRPSPALRSGRRCVRPRLRRRSRARWAGPTQPSRASGRAAPRFGPRRGPTARCE